MRLAAACVSAALALAALAGHATPCPPPPVMPGAAASAPAAPARDRGMLWRLTRDGRSSYLYATLHLGRPQWREPGPTVRQALRDTDLIALELDVTDPDVAAEFRRESAARPTPAQAVPPALLARLRRLAERACLPEGALAAMPATLQLMVLSALEGRWEDLHAPFGQELALKLYAMTNNRHVLSLESARLQLAAMAGEDTPASTASLERAVEQLEDGRARSLIRRLASAWERGDLDELAAYEQWCDCVHSEHDRRRLQRVNDARNPHLAARIDELHARDLKVFAAVGALHMTGPMALPLLLSRLGYEVERVPLLP